MRRKFFIITIALLGFSAAVSAREIDSLLVNAVQKYDNGDITAAALELFNLSRQYPDNDAIYYYWGLCDIEQENYIAAEDHLTLAFQLDSTNLWYANTLAEVCMARHNYEKAYPLLRQTISENPATFATPYSLCILAELECAFGNFQQAIILYDQSIAMDPSYYPARLGKSEALKMIGDNEGYMAEIESLMYDDALSDQLKAEYLSMSLNSSDSVIQSQWQEKITAIVDSCVTLYPDKFVFHFFKLQLADPNDSGLVIDECAAALHCSDTDTTRALFCLSLMGDTMYSSGDRKGAYKAYESALKLDGGYLPVLNNYAYFLSEEHRKLKKALKMSRITIDKEPDNPVYLDTYAWILHLLGNNEEAEGYLKKALVNGGRESRVILEHYADILEALGRSSVADFYRELSTQQQQ